MTGHAFRRPGAALGALAWLILATTAAGTQSTASFYKGRNVTIPVGSGAGGEV